MVGFLTNVWVFSWIKIPSTILKGVCHEIFDFFYFSDSLWVPGKQAKIFSNSVLISPRYVHCTIHVRVLYNVHCTVYFTILKFKKSMTPWYTYCIRYCITQQSKILAVLGTCTTLRHHTTAPLARTKKDSSRSSGPKVKKKMARWQWCENKMAPLLNQICMKILTKYHL